MGFSGISIWNLLIILAIVVLLFGTKRLKSLGSDLGGMLKGFKESMGDANKDAADSKPADAPVADVKAVRQDAAATPASSTETTAEKTSSQPK